MDARTGRSAMTAVVITAFELSEICWLAFKLPPDEGFRPRIHTKCCKKHLSVIKETFYAKSVINAGSVSINFILLTVCEILDPPTCRVVSTRCQAVPRTPPLQWATDNRDRIHWMFLAVSCQQRLQSYKQKKNKRTKIPQAKKLNIFSQ